MRILHIASGDFFSTYGGGQVYVKNVVDCMIDLGCDISVISHVGKNTNCDIKAYRGKELYEISGLDIESQLKSAIERIQPDIIHAHSLKHQVCRIGSNMRIPVIVTSHHGGILCPAGTRLDCNDKICHRKVDHKNCLPCVLRNTPTGLQLWYPLMKYVSENTYLKFGKWLDEHHFIPLITPIGSAARYIHGKKSEWDEIVKSSTCMIAPCNEIANAMIENGLSGEKIRVVPHGIPLPEKRVAFPPVVDGRIKFYYVGRICYVKGIHTLLEAFHSVENDNIELHLIGGAGNRHEMRYVNGLKKRYRNDIRIIWHGKISPGDIYEATCNYHVSITPSLLEAFGLNIAESLALGKPVLATRSGGAEMQIKDGFNGWLVPTNDSPAMANKINEIASRPESLSEMSTHCQAISIQDHCEKLINIYKESMN